jgi:hypothetical protein
MRKSWQTSSLEVRMGWKLRLYRAGGSFGISTMRCMKGRPVLASLREIGVKVTVGEYRAREPQEGTWPEQGLSTHGYDIAIFDNPIDKP